MNSRSFLSRLLFAATLFLAWGGASEARAQVCPGDTSETLITCLQAAFTPATVLDIDQARDTLFAVVSLEPGDLVTDVYTNLTIMLDTNADPNTDALSKGLNVEHTLPQSKGATEGTPAQPLPRMDHRELGPLELPLRRDRRRERRFVVLQRHEVLDRPARGRARRVQQVRQ